MAPARLPFWLAIVAPTLTNRHLSKCLGITPQRLAILRARFGIPACPHIDRGPLDIDWLCLLGQVEDSHLAELVQHRLGGLITEHLIAEVRIDLGVSAYSARKPKLLPNVLELIGKYTANNIAKGWDVNVQAVEAYRMLAKLDAPTADLDEMPADGRWTQESIALFPHHTNTQIARATGIPTERVRAKRQALRIAAPVKRSYWKIVDETELRGLDDDALATKYGGPASDYAGQRLALLLNDERLAKQIIVDRQLPPELEPYLNRMTVRQLSLISGLTDYQINKQMRGLGLSPFSPMSKELDSLLGTCPDTAIADAFHVAISTVKSRRDQLGIAAFRPKGRKG